MGVPRAYHSIRHPTQNLEVRAPRTAFAPVVQEWVGMCVAVGQEGPCWICASGDISKQAGWLPVMPWHLFSEATLFNLGKTGEDSVEGTERHKSRLCLGCRSGVHGPLQRVKKGRCSGKLSGRSAGAEVGIASVRNWMLHKRISRFPPRETGVVTLLTVPV